MKNVWKWSAAAAIVAAVGGLAWRQLAKEERPPAPAATTTTVERRTLEISVEASGTIEPIRVVEVKSRASGEVRRVLAETGDLVESGALIAEIDPRDVQNALDQAEADVASARVKARVVAAQLDRMRELVAGGVVPQQDLDSAEDAAASAEAAVLRAETNLSLARERRGDVTIRAPIAGTVLERQVEPGQIIASATANVSGGTPLFRMADLSAMRVRANIDETDIGRIRPGQPVRVTVEAYPGRTFRGEVEKIEPQAVTEQNVTQFPVLVRLDNAERLSSVGRLDIDTTGLVLLTDDGRWSHRVTAPRSDCFKRYRLSTAEPIGEEVVEKFARGLFLLAEKQRLIPAQLTLLGEHEALLEIGEGKYHQVKRMFGAVGNAVVALHREAIGAIELDPALAPGEYRALTADEIASI